MRESDNRRLLRARDTIDRRFAEPLDLHRLSGIACMSESHFIRSFRAAFGETPHRYLQRRRIERAMFLLRTTDTPITDICFMVGYGGLGTFSRTFADVVGESPTSFRSRGPLPSIPSCFTKRWTRPSSHVEDAQPVRQGRTAS